MKFLPLVICLIFCLVLSSQSKSTVSYLPENKDSIFSHLDKLREYQISNLLSDKNVSKKKKLYREKTKNIFESIEDSTFIFDKHISQKLNPILHEIYLSNPSINPTDFYFLINRSYVPNAACFGDGSFMLNMGLFFHMESDDELAFIICHELAHYELNHVNKKIESYIDTLNSKEIKHTSRAIKKQKYNRTNDGINLIKGLTFDLMQKSRQVEIEADSLGLIFFKNTKYNLGASISALQKLDSVDDMLFMQKTKIESIFNFPEYPFNNKWLKKEETLFQINETVNDYEFNKDSLKTHPDIPMRLVKLKMHENIQPGKSIKTQIREIKEILKTKHLNIYFDFKQFDFALYNLLLENENSINEEVIINTAILFKMMYEMKQKHRLGKYIPQPSPFPDEANLNEVRLFIHNLELKNIRKIGYFYCMSHEDKMYNNETFTNVYNFFKNLNQ